MRQPIIIIAGIIVIVGAVTLFGSNLEVLLPVIMAVVVGGLAIIAFLPARRQRSIDTTAKAAKKMGPPAGLGAILPTPSQLQLQRPAPQPVARPATLSVQTTVRDITNQTSNAVPQTPSTPVRLQRIAGTSDEQKKLVQGRSTPVTPTAPVSMIHLGTGVNGGTIALAREATLTSGLILEGLQNQIPMACRVLMEGWGRDTTKVLPILFVDVTNGSFTNLPQAIKNGCIAGCPDGKRNLPPSVQRFRYMEVTETNARDFGKHLMTNHLQVIFSYASYIFGAEPSVSDPGRIAGNVLIGILDGIREWQEEEIRQNGEPQSCVVMVTHAQKAIPQQDSKGLCADRAVVKALRSQLLDIQREQGQYGIWLYLIAPMLRDMDARAAQNSMLWIINRYPDEHDLEQVSALTMLDRDLLIHKADSDAYVVVHGSVWAGQVVMFRQTVTQHMPVTPPAKAAATTTTPITTTDMATHKTVQGGQTTQRTQAAQTSTSPQEKDSGSFSAELGAFACYLLQEGRLAPDLIYQPTSDLYPLLYALGIWKKGDAQDHPLSQDRSVRLCEAVTYLKEPERVRYGQLASKRLAAFTAVTQAVAPVLPQQTPAALHMTLPGNQVTREPTTGLLASDATDTQASIERRLQSSVLPWTYPALSLLEKPTVDVEMSEQDKSVMAKRIEKSLLEFGIYSKVLAEKTTFGPTVTSFAVQLTGKQKTELDRLGNMNPAFDETGEPVYEEGKRSTFDKLKLKDKDLAMALETGAIRMAPVLNTKYVGVEIPNKQRVPVSMYEIIKSKEFQEIRQRTKLPFVLGKNTAGNVRVYDLRRGPHWLIAGTTGSGKSVFLNTLICSLLYNATPEEVQFMMIDPKGIELAVYQDLPHLREAIVTDPELSAALLDHAVQEMKRRFKIFKRVRALYRREVKNIGHYHALQQHLKKQGNNSLENLPYIVVIIDELADLMVTAPKEIETSIFRLAQLARASGIHLVVATQRPDVTVLTGKIKVNIGARIAFALPSHQDSQTILGSVGAEDLLMRGDMLFKPQDAGSPERIQAPNMEEIEAERLVQHWNKLAATIPGAPQPPKPFLEQDEIGENEDDEDLDLDQAEQPQLDLEEEVLEDETASKATIALSEEEMTRIKELKWLLDVHSEGLNASVSLVRRRLYSNHTTAGKTIDRFVRLGLVGDPDPVTKLRDIYADKIVAILKQYGEEEIDLETGEKVSHASTSESAQTASVTAEAH